MRSQKVKSGRSPASQKLMNAFSGFRKLHWHHSPVEGLRPSEFWVLVAVKKAEEKGVPGIRVSDLAERLNVATPTATQLVKRLEAAEFVERERTAVDRRIVYVVLTAKGQSIMETVRKDLMESFDGLVGFMGEESSIRLAELLEVVSEYFTSKHRDDA
jgi:DNA-binding MarR family transcriptional regulator